MGALLKVLVVDDDAVVGKSFNRVLTRDKGYVVITAQNGAEALEKMRTQQYDLVFTDIKMPGMDGVELAEQVKARQPWSKRVAKSSCGRLKILRPSCPLQQRWTREHFKSGNSTTCAQSPSCSLQR